MEAYLMSKDQNIEKWSSMDTITDYLGVSRETVLQWINNRNMPAHKVGRLWKFKFPKLMNGFVQAVQLRKVKQMIFKTL